MNKIPKIFRKVYLSEYLQNKAVKVAYLILDVPEKLKGKKVRVKKVEGIDYVLTNSLVNVSSNFPKNW